MKDYKNPLKEIDKHYEKRLTIANWLGSIAVIVVFACTQTIFTIL